MNSETDLLIRLRRSPRRKRQRHREREREREREIQGTRRTEGLEIWKGRDKAKEMRRVSQKKNPVRERK